MYRVPTSKFADGRIGADTNCFLLYFFLLNGSDICRCSGSTVAQLRMGVSMQEVLGKIGKSLAVSIFDKNDNKFSL
jgi:hypothetical protein